MTNFFRYMSVLLLAMGFALTACNKDDDDIDYTKYYGWRDQNNALSKTYLNDILQLGSSAYFTDSIQSFTEPWAYSCVYRVLRAANEDSLRAINRWVTPFYTSTVQCHYTLYDTKSVYEFFAKHDMLNNQAKRNDVTLNNQCFGIGYQHGDPEYSLKADTLESAQVTTLQTSVGSVITGWTDALQHMHIGDSWLICIPWYLAYGQAGSGSKIDPYSNLYFRMELVDIDHWGATAP